MKQVLQSLKTGEIILEDVPCLKNNAGSLLIETTKSLLSSGTERMLLAFGRANVFGKIKQQPDKVKKILEKIKTNGLLSTLHTVQTKLDQPIALGYCNVGRVIDVGCDIAGFFLNDRIVSNAYHAEIVRSPKNSCVKIPDAVSDDEASFTVVSAIALQGIRLSQPTMGECYCVIGLGLIGLLTVQLLKAHGCRVLGVDFDETKCALAKKFGAEIVNPSLGENIISHAEIFSRRRGVDAVIITASTQSNETLHEAATICRQRGRIVLIGVIGNEYSRADFYEKELSFQVSCSYGPGRYDEAYEKKGMDYPVGFVRWTMQRNFEAVLDLMAQGVLNVKPLISRYFDIENVAQAYDELENNQSALGILIEYPDKNYSRKSHKVILLDHPVLKIKYDDIKIGLLGAGNYGATVLAPLFKKTGVFLQSVVSSEGVSAKRVAKKCGFKNALSDDQLVFDDSEINVVVIATRHNLHAVQAIEALEKNKHVFVEKPLAIYLADLEKIKLAYQHKKNNILMIGFNRRFSPLTQTIKKLLDSEKAPKSFIMTVNAGFIPDTHWSQDNVMGGGRIIGEACHFIDLLRYLADNSIQRWNATSVQSDTVTITLSFENGSSGTIHYLSNGHPAFPKERLEVFCDGKILQLDNFRKLIGLGFKHFKKQKLFHQNKGQNECVQAFINAIDSGKPSPIAFDEIMEVSRVSIEIAEYLRK